MPSASIAGAVLTIDLGAIGENYRRLKRRLGNVACAAVVKADAYGLGMSEVAPTLAGAGCGTFFVAHLSEGIRLRELLSRAEIFVLHGALPGNEPDFHAHDLIPVLNDLLQIDGWARLAREVGGLPAAVHADTGMNRLGLSPDEVDALVASPEWLEGIEVRYWMSHLVAAEEADHPSNREQLGRFQALRRRLPSAPASLANSSAIFLGSEFHFDMARSGVALYGVNPTPERPNPMAEALRLQSKIVALRKIDRSESVGYGAAYRAAGPRRIATVPVGYADGYLRSFGNCAHVGVAGQSVPVVGRISMDLITLDVTEARPETVHLGALVDLIGGTVPIDALAAEGNTIAYEVLTSLGKRYHRLYLGGQGLTV